MSFLHTHLLLWKIGYKASCHNLLSFSAASGSRCSLKAGIVSFTGIPYA